MLDWECWRDVIRPRGQTLKAQVEHLEKALIQDALRRHRWNRSAVAKELGLSRVGLSNKLKRYGFNGEREHG
jgi:two-component system response regulator HupR/HoxA